MLHHQPTAARDRTVIVDIVRGFALVGVLISNFTSYVEQQIPATVLAASSTAPDRFIMNFNSVFIEWKFMTLFSILFGYGFGLILESLDKKGIEPNVFFIKRMSWLFVFGIIHTLFWWGDVLNLYAMSGILLLLFRKRSDKFVLVCSIVCMFLLPAFISYLLRNRPDTFTERDITELYSMYKQGTLIGVMRFNLDFTYRMFFASGANYHDVVETLGRFLFGYYLVRIGLFRNVEQKKQVFKKAALISAPLMIVYFLNRTLVSDGSFVVSRYVDAAFRSIGILATTACYVSLLVYAFISRGRNRFFDALQSLGRMTLTNYLLISAFLVSLLYGFGLNQLGELPMRYIWLLASGWLLLAIAFSTYWLKRFRYGPAEWVWRQLTYWKRLPIRK